MNVYAAYGQGSVTGDDHGLCSTDRCSGTHSASRGGGRMSPEDAPLRCRIGSAVLYGFSSFFIVVVNKHVLSDLRFPSFQVLGLGQMVSTVVILYFLRLIGVISFPRLDWSLPAKIWPLPAVYVGNLVFGLGSTKHLSLPMMTVLRRFSILMTMLGERFFLRKKTSLSVQLSVYGMIFGAVIAALNDLAFDLAGYLFVLANDFFTAANGVISKKKLEARELGRNGLTYYNALFMAGPLFVITFALGDIERAYQYDRWRSVEFVVSFGLSCVLGTVLMYCTVLCTHYNSALTTTVIGCLKNIIVTYYGMANGADYIFTWANFVGLNISIVASVAYSYVVFSDKRSSDGTPAEHLPTLPTTTQQASNGKLLHT